MKEAQKQTPESVKEALEESDLVEINKDNLMQGLDSEGNQMPYYSESSEYGYEKFSRNPRNGGRWDLFNTGQYYSGITLKIIINQKRGETIFRQKFNNEKIRWLDRMLDIANRNPIGITNEQIVKAQIENKPKIAVVLKRIINGS